MSSRGHAHRADAVNRRASLSRRCDGLVGPARPLLVSRRRKRGDQALPRCARFADSFRCLDRPKAGHSGGAPVTLTICHCLESLTGPYALLVILRSLTRQSLRRSGYGSPAKAESRCGDGASEATRDLPQGTRRAPGTRLWTWITIA